MQISVEGVRPSAEDWRAARRVPREELPALTSGQKEVARKMSIGEEDYARTTLVHQKSGEALLAKARRFAAFLEGKLSALDPAIRIATVTLNTWDERFEIELTVADAVIPLRVAEDLVDDLFERGSADAENRLVRVLDPALTYR